MPTKEKSLKAQVAKRAAKQAEDDWNDRMGQVPVYLQAPPTEYNISPRTKEDMDPMARARNGMVEADPSTGDYVWIPEELGKRPAGASESRTEEMRDRIRRLRISYPTLWGQRSQAKTISREEEKEGRIISVRTIQKYFALVRKRTH